jgi:hypothetical protein
MEIVKYDDATRSNMSITLGNEQNPGEVISAEFSKTKIDSKSIPEGKFYYEGAKLSENDAYVFTEIVESAKDDNFEGSLILDKPLTLTEHENGKYLKINDEFNYVFNA